jgi:hypothetical protein
LTSQGLSPILATGFTPWMAEDRGWAGSMSQDRRHGQAFLGPMYVHRHHLLLHALFGFVAVILLFIQAIHPGIHPNEVLGPSTTPHVSCPISHAVADLPQGLPLLLFTLLVVVLRPAPRPWLDHLPLRHALAPRPPPALHR